MNDNPNLLHRLKERLRIQQQHDTQMTHLLYNAGGAGYVYNRSYLKLFNELVKKASSSSTSVAAASNDELKDISIRSSIPPPPEDMALALLMYTAYGILPQNTRDEYGRERFHPELPHTMYQYYESMYKETSNNNNSNNNGMKKKMSFNQARWNYLYQFQEHVPPLSSSTKGKDDSVGGDGGNHGDDGPYNSTTITTTAAIATKIQGGGSQCCSPYSISFHHVQEKHMKRIHEQIYKAKAEGEDSLVHTNNRQNLFLSSNDGGKDCTN